MKLRIFIRKQTSVTSTPRSLIDPFGKFGRCRAIHASTTTSSKPSPKCSINPESYAQQRGICTSRPMHRCRRAQSLYSRYVTSVLPQRLAALGSRHFHLLLQNSRSRKCRVSVMSNSSESTPQSSFSSDQSVSQLIVESKEVDILDVYKPTPQLEHNYRLCNGSDI